MIEELLEAVALKVIDERRRVDQAVNTPIGVI